MRTYFIASALALTALSPTPALAQPATAEAVERDAYDDFVASIQVPEAIERSFNAAFVQVMEAWKSSPDMQELEAECSGTIEAVAAAQRPIFYRMHQEEAAKVGKAQAALLRSEISVDHIREATAFFSSPLGRKLMLAVADNSSFKNSISDQMQNIDEDKSLDKGAYDKDTKEAALAAAQSLSTQEIIAIGKELPGQAWFQSYRSVIPKMRDVGFRTLNAPMDPETEKEIEETTVEAALNHMLTCR